MTEKVIGLASLVIGLASLVISLLPKIIGSYKRITTRPVIVGEWYSYHISYRSSKEVVREGKWKFNRNIFNKITVRVSYPDSEKKYIGKLDIYNSAMCIILYGDGFNEIVSIRLFGVTFDDTNDGIWIGPNEDAINMADYWFLSRQQITLSEAKSMIKKGRGRLFSWKG